MGFSKRVNHAANKYLGLALGIIVLWAARILAIDTGLAAIFPGGTYISPWFSMALGPLIYFYVLKITHPEFKFISRDFLHFSPLLLELSVQLVFEQLNLKLPVLAFISVMIYLYLSNRLIKRYYQSLKFNVMSDRYRYQLRWLHRLLTILGLLWLLWIPFTAVHYYYLSGISIYFPLYILLIGNIIWIAVVAHLRPESVRKEDALITRPSLPIDLRQKGAWLKRVMMENRYYQDPELSLVSLADKLDLTTHELSRIINTALKKNFNDFINEYRVAEVAKKMQNPAYNHLTLTGLAYDSGFNSPSTFHRIFKELKGKTPAEYKKELPFYNLTYQSKSAAVISKHETTGQWSHDKPNRRYMFRNYLKIAWRNIIRHKTYSATNIAGLTVGFATFLLIFLVVHYEQSFDQFHVHKNQLFRLIRVPRATAHESYRMGVPFPVGPSLRSNFPQLANAGAIVPDEFVQVIIKDNGNGAVKRFREERGIFFAEPQFFDMFSFPMVAGEYRNALKAPGNVLLTKNMGDKYFGHWQQAIGKLLRMDGVQMRVCGILKDMPVNTDFPIKAVLSYATHQNYPELKKFMNDWGYIEEDNYCFVQLNESDSPAQFKRRLKDYSDQFIRPVDPRYFLSIQPLNEMHFDARYGTFDGRVFSENLIIALSTIGIFLLIVACVNFINLSTAQAVNRAREVGVRKVMGSSRRQLILQFLGETALISCFAFLMALVVTLLFIPAINSLLDIHLTASSLYKGNMIFFLVSALVAVILLAGFYPAFLLSGFNPARVFKSTLSAQQGGISLRRGLVVFQFFVAQALIIVTLVMVSQMTYVNTADMGFSKKAILNAQLPQDSIGLANQSVLRNELIKIPGIEKVSFGSGAPISGRWFMDLRTPDNAGKAPDMAIAYKITDTVFFNLFHLQFIAGHPYANSDTSREFVVSENLTRKLGYRDPQFAIGKRVIVNGNNRPIVGVVKDFHVTPLRFSMVPVVLTTDKRGYGMVSVKLNLTQAKTAIAAMEKLWSKYYPDFAFTHSFLDDDINAFYRQETQISQLYKLFASVAIFISCLGLYGLITFIAMQRKKEIGVRKVLGAPASAILILLSREFTLLIGISFLIASPVAWYLMHLWLQQYAYRISLGPEFFVITIIGSILIAWVTVGYTALKAALTNPVQSLRND
ncbi:ABC transporter permease [Mucilaginibacter kameinonensis]|uniref:ABC transporter permease n=1 Tax=Mucilaginibacter kameinonensis TaxID=452286 RepID=UPI0013CF0DF7|nr:ABC transporter permease [Mucilaginibacter kameinonensis]